MTSDNTRCMNLKEDIKWILTMKSWESSKKAIEKTEEVEKRLWKYVEDIEKYKGSDNTRGTNSKGIIIKNAVKRVEGWLYYIDKEGSICMEMMNPMEEEWKARDYWRKHHG